MHQRIATFFAVVAIGLAAACASTAGGGGPSYDHDTITSAEIATVRASVSTAYEIVRRLRPDYLRGSPGAGSWGSRAAPPVYLNGARFGRIPSLKNIPASSVEEIRYIDARQATLRWGTGHTAGVIMVLTG